jgi:hypothetical protein
MDFDLKKNNRKIFQGQLSSDFVDHDQWRNDNEIYEE